MVKKLVRAELEKLFYILDYKLYWKAREVRQDFLRTDKTWNSRFAFKPAGTLVIEGNTDYLKVYFNGSQYYAHRIIWCMLVSEQVPNIIDHDDGNGLNNNPSNLRASSSTHNAKNLRKNIKNTSGITGVVYDRVRGKWVAQGGQNNTIIPLGRFINKQEAVDARRTWEEALGFTGRGS